MKYSLSYCVRSLHHFFRICFCCYFVGCTGDGTPGKFSKQLSVFCPVVRFFDQIITIAFVHCVSSCFQYLILCVDRLLLYTTDCNRTYVLEATIRVRMGTPADLLC